MFGIFWVCKILGWKSLSLLLLQDGSDFSNFSCLVNFNNILTSSFCSIKSSISQILIYQHLCKIKLFYWWQPKFTLCSIPGVARIFCSRAKSEYKILLPVLFLPTIVISEIFTEYKKLRLWAHFYIFDAIWEKNFNVWLFCHVFNLWHKLLRRRKRFRGLKNKLEGNMRDTDLYSMPQALTYLQKSYF